MMFCDLCSASEASSSTVKIRNLSQVADNSSICNFTTEYRPPPPHQASPHKGNTAIALAPSEYFRTKEVTRSHGTLSCARRYARSYA